MDIGAGDPKIDKPNNLRILYITLAVIIALFLLWIVMFFFTQEDAVKILTDMNNTALHTPVVTDTLPQTIDSLQNGAPFGGSMEGELD